MYALFGVPVGACVRLCLGDSSRPALPRQGVRAAVELTVRQLDNAPASLLEYARIESDCFSGRHVTNRIPLGKMNIPGRM